MPRFVRPLFEHEYGQYIPLCEYNKPQVEEGFEAIGDYLIPRIIEDTLKVEDYALLVELRSGERAALLLEGFFSTEGIMYPDQQSG